jgi:hypothetical protein
VKAAALVRAVPARLGGHPAGYRDPVMVGHADHRQRLLILLILSVTLGIVWGAMF